MLNVGRLGAAAAEYYIGEIAKSPDDYYTGHGEGSGRWVGSLARELGLVGQVDPVHFRRVLDGQHPFTETYLVSTRGSASRARQREGPKPLRRLTEESVDTLRAAAHLGVSAQYIRRLLSEGAAYSARLASARDGEVVAEPSAYLLGVKVDDWTIARDELQRFAERRRQSKARPGYDLTLRPPKSVSILWALCSESQREAIRQAHSESVDEVVRYYEDRAVFVREGSGARRLAPSAGIVAAAFDHRSSRAGDPLLHTHVVTANMTCTLGGEEKWRTIAGTGLFEHAKAAGHLYQAHLRYLLGHRLGIQFGAVQHGYADVVGVPAAAIEVFSKRRSEIEDVLSESGGSSARAAQVATLDSRQSKTYEKVEALGARWRTEAEAAGFGGDAISACFGHSPPTPVDDKGCQALFEALAGAHGLTERSATFSRAEVVEAVSSATGASASASEVQRLTDVFLGSTFVLPLERGRRSFRSSRVRAPTTERIYTTPQLAALEGRLLAWMQPSVTASLGLEREVVERVLQERPDLSAEQATMVRAACEASEFCLPIAGRPGAGKTFATEAIVAAHVAAGRPIVGCSVSAIAAAELEAAAGFARSTDSAMTVAGLLVALERPNGGLLRGTVILVDEASMIGTRDLVRLAAAAISAGGSIRLVGDYDQHGSVEVGGVFRRLCLDRGDALVRLVENNRQQHPADRLAVEDYRDGRVADALARYDDEGRVVRSRTAGESFDAIVADWYAARLNGAADPMIAGPNSTRRALNDRARHLLKSSGELSGKPLFVGGREFMVGDEIVARRNDRTLRRKGSRDFVKNGSVGTVIEIDHGDIELTVDFLSEGRIRVPRRYLSSGRVEHAYARTTYGVQGTTHNTALYHPTDVSSFEEGYVALTRGRLTTRIYLVDGNVPDVDEGASHAGESSIHFGMTEIAAALARRRAGRMAADLADGLSELAEELATTPLRDLTAHRIRLEQIIAASPGDASHVLERTRHAIEKVRARQRAWMLALETHATAEEPAKVSLTRVQASLRSLEIAEQRLQRTLDAAERQQREHDHWHVNNEATIAEYELTCRSERAREAQIRSTAVISAPEAVRRLIGDEPDSLRARHTWRRAVEATALYVDRYGGDLSFLRDDGSDSLGRVDRAEQVALRNAVGPAMRLFNDREHELPSASD